MKKTGEKCRKTGDLMVVETKSKQKKKNLRGGEEKIKPHSHWNHVHQAKNEGGCDCRNLRSSSSANTHDVPTEMGS